MEQPASKSEELLNLLARHTRVLREDNIPIDDDTPVFGELPEEDREDYERIKGVLANTIEEMLEKSSTFDMDGDYGLKRAVLLNPEFEQKIKYQDLLDRAVYEYEDDIVYIGPKELGLYTTRSQLETEKELIRLISKQSNSYRYSVNKDLVLDVIAAKEKKNGFQLTESQKKAVFASTLTYSHNSLYEGYAGAGKSTSADIIANVYSQLNYGLMGVTLSWKAAEVLKNETNMNCLSVRSFIDKTSRSLAQMNQPFDRKMALFFDEAGLINMQDMLSIYKLVDAAQEFTPVKMIFSGDTEQLNPIGGANALELVRRVMLMTAKNAHATIKEIRRQDSLSHREIVINLKDGYSGSALYALHQQQAIKFCKNQKEMRNRVIADYFAAIKQNPKENILIIGLDNNEVREIGRVIRNYLIKIGHVERTGVTFPIIVSQKGDKVETVYETFAVGDKIVFNQQDKKIFHIDSKTHKPTETFLMNKSSGFIKRITAVQGRNNNIDSYDIEVEMKNNRFDAAPTYVIINSKKFGKLNAAAISLNYAITAYSSQGQTVQRVLLMDNERIDRRYAYVCCSRHRESLQLYVNVDELAQSMKTSRVYNQSKPIEELTTIDYLNYVGFRWNRANNQSAVSVKLMDLVEDVKAINRELKTQGKLPISLDNLPYNFKDIYRKYKSTQFMKEREKSLVQEPDGVLKATLFDPPEYYKMQHRRVDFRELIRRSTEEEVLSPTQRGKVEVPLSEQSQYPLSGLLDQELFRQYKGEYWDIGKGGELNFLSVVNGMPISKYTLFGEDTLQNGYPFLITSGEYMKGTPDVYVLQDMNMLLQYMKVFYLEEKGFTKPTLIWGTQDTDYRYISDAMNGSNIYLLGDDQFKTNQFFKITQARSASPISVRFKNIGKNVLDNFDAMQLHQQSLDHVQFADNVEPEKQDNSWKIVPETLSDVCDQRGYIYNDFLREMLVNDGVLEASVYDKKVAPTRSDLPNNRDGNQANPESEKSRLESKFGGLNAYRSTRIKMG